MSEISLSAVFFLFLYFFNTWLVLRDNVSQIMVVVNICRSVTCAVGANGKSKVPFKGNCSINTFSATIGHVSAETRLISIAISPIPCNNKRWFSLTWELQGQTRRFLSMEAQTMQFTNRTQNESQSRNLSRTRARSASPARGVSP